MAGIETRIISRRRLQTLSVLGEGAFGTVYRGIWSIGRGNNARNITVAIKILNHDDEEAVFHEVRRMQNLEHSNIIELFGISYPRASDDDVIPWLITEYMEHRSLIDYIMDHARGGMKSDLMIHFAYGIASGMAYLHHEAVQRHGDLAARNCLVGANNEIKIGDFGRFNNDYTENYYDGGMGFPVCPVRWMPPENLPTYYDPEPKFTRKGDVWAYGVVLFEIWTRGSTPFEDLNNEDTIRALRDGDLPWDHKRVHCAWYIRELMDDCWESNPQDRPNFKRIKRHLETEAGATQGQ